MGEVRRPNEVLSSHMVLVILAEVDKDQKHPLSPNIHRELDKFICAFLISFWVALRGEEITLVSLNCMISM
jgi:hypothetical protein